MEHRGMGGLLIGAGVLLVLLLVGAGTVAFLLQRASNAALLRADEQRAMAEYSRALEAELAQSIGANAAAAEPGSGPSEDEASAANEVLGRTSGVSAWTLRHRGGDLRIEWTGGWLYAASLAAAEEPTTALILGQDVPVPTWREEGADSVRVELGGGVSQAIQLTAGALTLVTPAGKTDLHDRTSATRNEEILAQILRTGADPTKLLSARPDH